VATERPITPASDAAEARYASTSLSDLEAVRLLLRGNSVVDWHRLDLRDHDEVDRFLRVNEFDPSRERDMSRLERLREDAVDYLVRSYGFRIPEDIAEALPARDLFLIASRKSKRQRYACIVLKVMHIIHHLAGRELLFRLPISDTEVFSLVERKVVRIVEEIRAAKHPIVEFEWSRKPRDSLVTKLLAKKSTLATSIWDKLRFRLVLREREDILPVLIEMTHRLIPFNYIVPGESVNLISPMRKAIEDSVTVANLAQQLQPDLGNDDPEPPRIVAPGMNEFSGPGYKIINFVADLPVRVDDFIARIGDPDYEETGAVVFVLTEFQVVDARTAHDNETGENSHEKYKERQHARVKQRLLRGFTEKSSGEESGGGEG
jgi:uncharacterized protein (TIGR04552 family)